MRKRKLLVVAVLALGLCLAANPGGAVVVTSLPGGTVYPMPNINYTGPGPEPFGSITWSSTNATSQGGSCFGYSYGYGFGGNGYWYSPLVMAGVNDSYSAFGVTDTMTFAFATPVAGVGGFLNYVPYGSTPTTIAVYNAANTLLESYNLTFLTGGGNDTGQFLGFQETTKDISYFTLTDNYIGITNLTTTNTPVPIPGAVWLLGSGLVGLARLRRKLS